MLVVEDDADLRRLLVTVVREAGFSVAEAGDGKRALELCAEQEPDLIVLDLDLPRLTGLEFLERHRRDHECAGKVVVLTALRFTDDERTANRVDAVMPKPFLIDELVATVHRLLPAPGVFH